MSLQKSISKRIGRAIFKYKLIKEDDKILVAVSGGKDSITLLDDLVHRQKGFPIKYKLSAVYLHPDFAPIDRIEIIKRYVHGLNVDFTVKNLPVLKRIKDNQKMNCFWCSTQRRIELMKVADELGCNKIALGHHLDDIAETMLMNICFNGETGGMLPCFHYDKFNKTIIRPLAFVKESLITKYIKEINYEPFTCNCGYNQNSKRLVIREIIQKISDYEQNVRENILKSMHNINSDYLLSDFDDKGI